MSSDLSLLMDFSRKYAFSIFGGEQTMTTRLTFVSEHELVELCVRLEQAEAENARLTARQGALREELEAATTRTLLAEAEQALDCCENALAPVMASHECGDRPSSGNRCDECLGCMNAATWELARAVLRRIREGRDACP